MLISNENSLLLLGGVVVSSFEVLADKVVQLGVIEGSKDPAEHVDFVGDVEAAGIVVELLGFEITVDLAEETFSLLKESLVVDFDDEGRVDGVHGGFSHQRTVGLVVIIVRVGEGLIGVVVGRYAGGELGGSGVLGGLEVEVLDGHTIDGLSLVTERLGRQSVDGLDALDDKVAVLGGATVDVDSIGVLFVC